MDALVALAERGIARADRRAAVGARHRALALRRRMPIPRLVLASGNEGKLREFRRLLGPLGIEVIPQATLGIPDADEPHVTFVENALAKARHASRLAGLPALADDSGVCVRALGGAPGVQSAALCRRAEIRREEQREADRRAAGVPDRAAHYACVLVLVRHADDPEPIIAEGAWHGDDRRCAARDRRLRLRPALPGHAETGMTGAELPLEQKNELSHRGKAMRALIAKLRAEG